MFLLLIQLLFAAAEPQAWQPAQPPPLATLDPTNPPTWPTLKGCPSQGRKLIHPPPATRGRHPRAIPSQDTP